MPIKHPTGTLVMHRVYKKNNPIDFASKFTNDEAIEAIRPLAEKNDFARSLVEDYDAWNGSVASVNKRAWFHYLAVQEYERQEKGEATTAGTTLHVPGALKLFLTASASGLKLPEIYLALGKDQREVKLKLAPAHGKNPNCVYVTCGGDYCGKIDKNGTFHPAGERPEGLPELLMELHRDPVGTAKHYGKITSRCCFCGLKLSNITSIYNGYGEICAGRYNLPYSNPPTDWKPSDEITAS